MMAGALIPYLYYIENYRACPMNVGCTAAIEASFIAFGLHDI